MPYDKNTRDALQAYYETHDFTGNIPAFDDKKIYARTTSDLWQGEKVFCTVMAEAPSRNGQQALDEKFLEKLSTELSERRRRGVHCGYGCRNYGR